MTSEAPHRPGQEPGEVSPGTGGPVPYGAEEPVAVRTISPWTTLTVTVACDAATDEEPW